MSYERKDVKVPIVSGLPLRALIGAIESGAGGLLRRKLLGDSGIEHFRAAEVGHSSPIQVPLPHPPPPSGAVGSAFEQAATATGAPRLLSDKKLETVADFAAAYRARSADPVAVMHRLHEAIGKFEGGDEKMGFFISRKPIEVLAAAEASTRRLHEGKPLSVFDGVPVVVKDEVDMEGFETTLGTNFIKRVATRDSAVVARLKAAGAVILGKANMNEIGINPVGLNPHFGVTRNPWNKKHLTGGSSSGSAAVVAAGLCPVAIGADGGGSIRIPAGLCGVVGLKATFGRISEAGVPPLCWNVGHVGPIGLTVADVAAAYAVIAGPDAADPVSLAQPAPHLSGFTDGNVEGLRIGICRPYFDDADPDLVARSNEAVQVLVSRGAKVVEIPPPDAVSLFWAHVIIITSEMAEGMRQHIADDVTRFALLSRVNLGMVPEYKATDLLHAMRFRQQLTREHLELMKTCDVMVTPNTATPAPLIPEAALPEGASDIPMVEGLMRFVRAQNLTGFPAISLPAGYCKNGLPASVHFTARPYEEPLLLRLGRIIESHFERRVPPAHTTALS